MLGKIGSFLLVLLGLLAINGCVSQPKKKPATLSRVERLTRRHQETICACPDPVLIKRENYPWEEGTKGIHPRLTKEFFRCKGSSLNPVHVVQRGKEEVRFYDCGGARRHSLPLRDQKEFIYPILIDILNYLQDLTGKRVVITCGHCCPDHCQYLDPSPQNQTSKHLIGAEVDFYIEGMESQPEEVVEKVQQYYRDVDRYRGLKEYQEFKRYSVDKTNVSTSPWYNKEIFIKLVKKGEGRDFDNRHPYPYLTLQVRYDWDMKENVSYTWEKAFGNFHRR